MPLSTRQTTNVFGVILNYQDVYQHFVPQFNNSPYLKPPQKPVLFVKTPNTYNVDGGTVCVPNNANLQPGPALGVIFGQKTSRVSKNDVLNYVASYVIINEFSLPEDSYYRPAIASKCRDGFCVIGTPVVANKVTDPQSLTMRLLINGEVKQQSNTQNMVRSTSELVSQISQFMTFNEGDILITGTPYGRVNVAPGDNVIIEIEQLGQVQNAIVAEQN